MKNEIRKIIQRHGLPFNGNIPTVGVGIERTSSAIRGRAMVLNILYTFSYYPAKLSFFQNYIERNDLTSFLTPVETAIIDSGKWTNQDLIDLSWSKESLYVLLWALGLLDMKWPIKECDADSIYNLMPPVVGEDIYNSNEVAITNHDLAVQLNIHMYVHWAVRHPEEWSIINRLRYAKYNTSLVRARRLSLEWLANRRLNWEQISLDT